MTSLRARLLLTVSLASLIVWGAVILGSYNKALHEADELLDSQLVQAAELLRAQIQHEDDLWQLEILHGKVGGAGRQQDAVPWHWVTEVLNHDTQGTYAQKLAFVVSDRHGIRLRSANILAIPATQKNGIVDLALDDGNWRVLTTRPTPALCIQVAHRRDIREKAALEVAQQVALAPLLAFPLLIGLVYLSVQRGLRPLKTLSDTVAHLTTEHLEPVLQTDTPDEVRPLLNAINQLLRRINAAITRERRFTSEAAHELRTPIAALKIQAQVAASSLDADDRAHALTQVLQGIQRAERLIDQMLRLARLDPAVGLENTQTLDLPQLLQDVFEATESMVLAQGHSLLIAPMDMLPSVPGDAELLRTALINLIHNACLHTPPGCHIRLCAEATDEGICLAVRDDGPGVAVDEIGELAVRFRRGRSAVAAGSGLGLAIVQRIAELHHATLRLNNLSPRGFEAAICFK